MRYSNYLVIHLIITNLIDKITMFANVFVREIFLVLKYFFIFLTKNIYLVSIWKYFTKARF